MKNNGLIYRARCLTDGRAYIGATTRGLEVRRREHERGGAQALHQAIVAHGKENFVWDILAREVPAAVLARLEAAYILGHRVLIPGGYNTDALGWCGNGRAAAAQEWRRRQSRAGYTARKGRLL